MGNPIKDCPFILLIMRFFLACTDFCIKWCKFDVNRCFFSFLSNEVRSVYLVKRYIFTSRRLASPCVFRLMSVFASAHRRKAQFLILIELCTCRNVVINHQKMKLFFAFFFVNSTEEHTARVNAHHSSRWKICDSNKSLSNQLFRLIKAMNTA